MRKNQKSEPSPKAEPLVIDFNHLGEDQTDLEKYFLENSPSTQRFLYQLDHQAKNGHTPWIHELFPEFKTTQDGHATIFNGIWYPYTDLTKSVLIAGYSPASEDEHAELIGIEAKIKGYELEANKNSLIGADQEYADQLNSLVAGQPKTVRTRADIKHSRLLNLKSIQIKTTPLTKRAAELSIEIIRRAMDPIKLVMLESEASSRQESASFGIIWKPPGLWQACGHILVDMSDFTMQRLILLRSPRNMLKGLIDL